MNKYFTFGYRLPALISNSLFGERERWGLVANKEDKCWRKWTKAGLDFYYSTQKSGIGERVNNAGYKVMDEFDLSNKTILEVGPGHIKHIPFWRTFNDKTEYVIADVNRDMLDVSSKVLTASGINHHKVLLERGQNILPFPSRSFDYIVSFFALEHIYPLEPYLAELHRVLKPGGRLLGAIPCEGGLAWGMGRYITSRRWLLNNTSINPDKIICWEHPNFADKVMTGLESIFTNESTSYWPLCIPAIDLNLVLTFKFKKEEP